MLNRLLASPAHNAQESPAVHTHFGHRETIPEQHRNDVREASPQLWLGVHVARRPGQPEPGEDLVEHHRHLVAEVAAGAGHQLIAGRGDGEGITHPETRR